ncbi:glycosyltransferase family 4 protein [Streptomyces sp. NPDC060027]|uniref:glycosyltransferase family 4 protein n=1 Tax=Streptomyces sp. NPDC060027 TaxID=3347040 RepID=UPI0036B29472
MRIHFWTADGSGSGLYRGVLPAMSLHWLGHDTSANQRLPEDWRNQGFDVVVGCRIAKPGTSRTWREMRDHGIRLVMDLDDDYFHLDFTNPAARKWADPVLRQGLLANIGLSDTVTCCSESLAAVLREVHGDVRVVPNGLPAQYLGAVRDYNPETLSVGWAGTSSTMHELQVPGVVRGLNRIADYGRPGGVAVQVVGLDAAKAIGCGLQGARLGACGWVEDFGRYLQAVSAFDVWVAPYRDTAFNRAKYPTKWLESSMLGIPLIASDIEPYRRVIRHGENGFLVKREHEWGRLLKQLADDPALRQRIGMAARAEASASILQATNVQWQAALTAPIEERTAA